MTKNVSKFKTQEFDKCVEIICKSFCIEPELLFSKNRETELVDARRILYLACYYKGFRPVIIHRLMEKNGCKLMHSTITSGYKKMEIQVEKNREYKRLLNKLC